MPKKPLTPKKPLYAADAADRRSRGSVCQREREREREIDRERERKREKERERERERAETS
jgi:hypothetical protein